jgi:hypothetical protein
MADYYELPHSPAGGCAETGHRQQAHSFSYSQLPTPTSSNAPDALTASSVEGTIYDQPQSLLYPGPWPVCDPYHQQYQLLSQQQPQEMHQQHQHPYPHPHPEYQHQHSHLQPHHDNQPTPSLTPTTTQSWISPSLPTSYTFAPSVLTTHVNANLLHVPDLANYHHRVDASFLPVPSQPQEIHAGHYSSTIPRRFNSLQPPSLTTSATSSAQQRSLSAGASSPLTPVINPQTSEMERWGRRNSRDGTWSCAYPGCTSRSTFFRACDLRKHYKRHEKTLFCKHADCAKATGKGFSSRKDLLRHETKHNRESQLCCIDNFIPKKFLLTVLSAKVTCTHPGCNKLFSRVDNMVSPSRDTSVPVRAVADMFHREITSNEFTHDGLYNLEPQLQRYRQVRPSAIHMQTADSTRLDGRLSTFQERFCHNNFDHSILYGPLRGLRRLRQLLYLLMTE